MRILMIFVIIRYKNLGILFQLANRRYEHASTVFASNKGFEQWGEIRGDEVMAASLLDGSS